MTLKAPFPYFGGKSRATDIIWPRLGDVGNYVEPFAGSLAVLLGRTTEPKIETVNDLDCYLSNFWRALKTDPDAVAHHADWPVNEADLLARHKWLINQDEFRTRMKTDPDYYDVKIAGWWVWGMSAWIGAGWARQESQKLPHLGDAGHGINRKLPHLGDAGRGDAIRLYFQELANRLRDVRVCCGDWTRVTGPSVTYNNGLTGILLDPPYDVKRNMKYSVESNVSADVRAWAIENGSNPLLRIALCGYEGEHNMPDDWVKITWKSKGGYGSIGDNIGRKNKHFERIWFSPHCLTPARQGVLL